MENGATYSGEAIKEIANASSLEADWMLPHGRGELVYTNGDKYIG